MKRQLVVAALSLSLLSTAVQAAAELPFGRVVLQGLDKVTARVQRFEVPIHSTVRFGTLEIRAEACFETPPVEPPESAAFLVVDAIDPGRPVTRAFSGWMFASSPSLSALEHPVYDIWVLDCAEPLAPSSGQAPSEAQDAASSLRQLPAELPRPNSE
jgi:hypothetical protein